MMPNFPSLKMRSFGHSLKGKRQKVPHFLLLFFAKINQIYLHFLLGLERYKRSGAYKCSGALQMLRSSTRAPEGLKYRSSGSGYSWAPLRGAKILNARLQPELKMPYAPLRSAPAPERSETLVLSYFYANLASFFASQLIT